MESIRPDADELRAGAKVDDSAGSNAPGRKRRPAAPAQDRSLAKGGRGDNGEGGSSGSGRGGSGRGSGLLWLLVLIMATGGGWFGWQMHSKVELLESQLEEADYWVRQSKLALARFEGDLSETGENLEQRGSSIDEQLDKLQQALTTSNDEIRKLWVLSNERNRPRIESLTTELEAITGTAAELKAQLARVEVAQAETDEAVVALNEQGQVLDQRLVSLDDRVDASGQDVDRKIAALENKLTATEQRVEAVVASAEEAVDSRLQRFAREQKLAADGLEGRVAALERGDSKVAPLERQLGETRQRLAEAEQTLKAVDASRAQLTSRLVRLQEQVDRLASD